MIYWTRNQWMGARRNSATNPPIDPVLTNRGPINPTNRVPIDPGFLAQLREHVAAREIDRGMACLRSHHDLIAKLDPSQENAAHLLAQLAIWTDIGFSGPPLRELLERFENSEPGLRSKLPISGYLCLRMAEGAAAMAEEAMETAMGHFDFVLSLAEELRTKSK